jgi:cellulose synthase/poly-beta-1,6-N-acetylglucosamine synthase-like glycosyltransferase/glycosyltransferase involved in cell wall biosynthesis
MKLAIIDKLGLCYDGDTLSKQGLGGSESAIILISKKLRRIGFDVTVFNNCKDGSNSKTGIYDNVRYIDNSDAKTHTEEYDIVISSRSIAPFISKDWPFLHTAKKRILWLHDTFIEGDQIMEDLVVSGKIDHIFTLSDWHTTYILNAAHGPKRNFEVLKKKIFQTRNGAVCHIPEVDLSKKDPNHFVYNSSATKGMIPLLEDIWPEIKKRLPDARLTVIGGYYRFREGAAPDAQESTVEKLSKSQELKDLGVTFTGVISQQEIAKILANAWMMLYPGAFPETFGISTLESLLYKTPLVTTRFGALEETAVEQACYLIDYAIEPNSLFPHIDKKTQVHKFLNKFFEAYSTPYLHQQKQNYCDVVKGVAGWDTVALQWKQFFYSIMGEFLSVDEYRRVTHINDKVSRVFGRTSIMPVLKEFRSYGKQRRIVVISPFWNSQNYIERNILSIAQQEYDNYVHILIDDASTDDSFQIARDTIDRLPKDIQEKFRLIKNESNVGAIVNQIAGVSHCKTGDIVMLLDGDDWLINNNTIFHYYNDLYLKGYEFTYGSMWSIVDNIPLISQEYPREVRENRSYRDHHFNWKIPYTHLRTCLSDHFFKLDVSRFKVDGEWMKSGADNPLFYELIERVDPDKIYCNREIVCMYNDANPLNDYKIRGEEQNKNANRSYAKKFSVVVPTMWRANDLFKRSLESLVEHDLVDEVLVINNQVDKTPDWGVLQHVKIRLLKQEKNIKVNPSWNLGVEMSRNSSIAIINDDLCFDTRLFDRVRDHMEDEKDLYCFAVGGEKYNQPDITDGKIDLIEWKPGVSSYGYGQLMIVNKKYWKPIVDGLDFYFGDDFIFKSTLDRGGRVFLILNMRYEADFGSTTRELGINQEYYDREKLIYNNWIESIDNEKGDTMKRILIAIPTNKYIESETFKSIYDLDIPEGYEVDFQFFYGYQIDQIRNLIAEWAKNYDYLFSVDSDIVLPSDSLRKMIEADKDIVTGLYIQRIPNTHTLEVYMVNPVGGLSNIPYELLFQHDGLVEVAGCGFGCCLVKGEVFRRMEYPHFYYQSALDHKNTVSEDVYFCKKARDLGFAVWADTTIVCDHKGSTFYKVNSFPNKETLFIPEIAEEKDNGITVIPESYRKEKVFR